MKLIPALNIASIRVSAFYSTNIWVKIDPIWDGIDPIFGIFWDQIAETQAVREFQPGINSLLPH